MQGDGGYNGADYEFTRSFTDLEQRDEALKAKIKERLETMGPSGVYKLALAKAEKCFSDGTYEHNAFFIMAWFERVFWMIMCCRMAVNMKDIKSSAQVFISDFGF